MKQFLRILGVACALALTLLLVSHIIPFKQPESNSVPAPTEAETQPTLACVHSFEEGVCSACGEADPDYVPTFDLAGSSLTLGNDLAFSFYANVSDLTGEDYVANIVKERGDGGQEIIDIPFSLWESYYGMMYKFDLEGISAKEMTDKIAVTIYNADGVQVSNTWTDSISEYATRHLEDSRFSAAHTLLADMLNYGAAAQIQFAYNLDELANQSMTAEQAAFATSDFDFDGLATGTLWGEGYIGSSLSLEDNIILTMYFQVAAPVSTDGLVAKISYTNHTGELHSTEVTKGDFITLGSNVGIVIDTLAAADAGQVVSVEIYDGDTLVACGSDSVADYAARQRDETAVALMKFTQSAYEYLH